jgi:hypothetical protein
MGRDATLPAATAADGQRPDLESFIDFCKQHDLALERVNDGDEWKVVRPATNGYDEVFWFKSFPPGTSVKEMRDYLSRVQLGFPYINERAAIAMPACNFRVWAPLSPQQLEEGKLIETRLAKLLSQFNVKPTTSGGNERSGKGDSNAVSRFAVPQARLPRIG